MSYVAGALVLILAGSEMLSSQHHLPGSEATLTTLDPSSQGGPMAACGRYFSFSGVPKDPTQVGIVFFIAVSTGEDGLKDYGFEAFGSDKLEVHVAKQKVPKMKVIRAGGPILPWLEIWVSPEDFEQAPCLAHSKVVRH